MHLRGTAAAGYRPRRCREDHRHAHLARAWRDSGGQVVGLAPSAAAAAQLRDATGVPADTLAKLTRSIHHADLPD
jgi:AAA domain